MYGSQRPASRSLLGDLFGFDPMNLMRNPEAYGFDIERTDQGYRIELPVAGFKPDEISVTIEDRQLRVEGRSERRRFTRAITLPDEIDAERIDAHVDNGLLTLMLPLHPKMQPRRIDVRVGSGQLRTGTVPSVTGETLGAQAANGGQSKETAEQAGR
ncbi:hypothetical protein WPS_18950 [Vulcanimicrobium alpinum]|uniref:SHSP domain-containing protein n=1 Tax=Vulcanimicrobium alpinum TaxID=3016050 RepID=A0AAN1XWF2_UNVUL|nr:Hsp20/alpha crystallin family protein [Vulcanimicrobium alpinum]BDE06619.1 hypothetical protein WPS_18950 [Vulcanimicrobium alpinum]